MAVTRLRKSLCNPASSVPCIQCNLFSVSRGLVSVSGSWESVWWILDLLRLGPGDEPITTDQDGRRFWGWDHPEKSSNFEPVCKAAKVMNIRSKDNQNHQKRSLSTWEIWLLWKLSFAISPMPNAASQIGQPNWPAKLACQIDRPNWPANLAGQIGQPNWPVKLASQTGHPTRPANLASQNGLPDLPARLGSQIGQPNWLARLANQIGQANSPAKSASPIRQPNWPARSASQIG